MKTGDGLKYVRAGQDLLNTTEIIICNLPLGERGNTVAATKGVKSAD